MFREQQKNNLRTPKGLPILTEEEKVLLLGGKVTEALLNQDLTSPDSKSLGVVSNPESLKLKNSNSRFRTIEADYYHFNKSRVEELLALLKKAQRLELSPDEKKLATFFVAENQERKASERAPSLRVHSKSGVYGGAVLLKKKIRNAHRNRELSLRESRFAFQGEEIWSCSLGLAISNKDAVYMSGGMVAFCRGFYEELYDKLVEFGRERRIPFLWLTLDAREALCLEELGDFPFLLQMKPQDTTDGLFHGILSLKKDLSKSCLNMRGVSPLRGNPLRGKNSGYRLLPQEEMGEI